MSDYDDGDNKYIVTMFIVAIVFVLVAVGGIYLFNKTRCGAMTRDIGYESRYSLFGDCQVEINNQWIPLNNYRFFGDQ